MNELSALLTAQQDSAPRFGDDVVRAVIALLCLDVARLGSLPPPLVELLGDHVLAAGLQGNEPPDVLVPRVRAHLETVIPAELRAAIDRSIRAGLAAGQEPSAALNTLLGIDPQKANRALDSGPRPAGTVAASPLARFLVRDKKPSP